MNASTHIRYAQRSDATPETELSALSAVYKLCLSHARKEAAAENRPDDGTKSKEDSANEHHSR
jgi:hypothetical protein